MYIETVPNRGSPPAILLRESYRVGGKVKKRTLLNLTGWPRHVIDGLRALLKGGTVLPAVDDGITIKRSLPHGHVAAVLGTLRSIGLDQLLGPAGNRCRDLIVAMIVARLIAPVSKLATAKALDPATAASSLGSVLRLGEVDKAELYTALDWLFERQPQIEAALARRHLRNGTLVLYDVSPSYLEGRCCPLAQLGYNRDRKRGKLQIVYGLLCAPDGCPVAIEVFEGSTGDPMTLAAQIEKVKQRFDLTHVVLVGDRGMITQARIDEDIKPAKLDWITALRAPAIKALLAATERELAAISTGVRRARDPLRGQAEIALKVGAVINKYKVAKHFTLTISDSEFSFARKIDAIDDEARLDGIYVVRTCLTAKALDDNASVRAYKSLAQVERAIRSIKTVDLQIRPIFHWAAPRVCAHVCLCMLAYYVEWHMRRRLAPMLYDDADKEGAEALRTSVVARAQRSPSALAKQTYGTTADGLPVHSLHSLLADLATLARNTLVTALRPDHEFVLHTRPTAIQQKALDLLGVNVAKCTQ